MKQKLPNWYTQWCKKSPWSLDNGCFAYLLTYHDQGHYFQVLILSARTNLGCGLWTELFSTLVSSCLRIIDPSLYSVCVAIFLQSETNVIHAIEFRPYRYDTIRTIILRKIEDAAFGLLSKGPYLVQTQVRTYCLHICVYVSRSFPLYISHLLPFARSTVQYQQRVLSLVLPPEGHNLITTTSGDKAREQRSGQLQRQRLQQQ